VAAPVAIGVLRWQMLHPEPAAWTSHLLFAAPVYAAFLAYPLLFVLLGAGFMLIEVSLIQRFMLFLGRPVLVLAVILFVLLIGMSAGSMLSGRIPPSRTAPAIVGAGTAAALLVGVAERSGSMIPSGGH
jgi:hypothetical protein